MKVWTGKAGGPVKDLVGLYGEILAVERAPIHFEMQEGKGSLRIGKHIEAKMAPLPALPAR